MAVDITSLSIRVESTGIKEASNALGGLSTSAGNAEKKVLALVEAMKKINTVSATLNATAGSTAALTAALNALNTTLSALNQRTQQADQSQRRHNDGMREAHGLARGLSGSMGALWLTYGNLVSMIAGVAIGSALKNIFTMGKDIEHTLEGIRVKGMESVDSIDKMRESILDLGTGIYGPREVAKAFDTLVMAGLSAQQAMTGMKDALNLALIGGTTVEKAAFTLVQVGTALGYTAEGYSRIGDVIAKTAAVSMSSVESLSEAFKSGSVVGKLYGISIVDIGTAFAALSNLGIRGSAAGTSLKNMYKELAADSDKLKNTLNLIGLKPQQLKDVEGNFLPMVQLFDVLDKGLSKYTAAEQKTLMARMANERGMKSLVEVMSLYREKLDGTSDSGTKFSTRLEQMNIAINESYGFMAQGAAAMALTVDSQFKSVGNTLQVTLIKAFQDIQPEMSLVAKGLKDAFGSSEFTTAIQSLATGVASFTMFLVDNAAALGIMFKALLAFKAATIIAGVISGVATSLVAMKVALDAARISAIAFQASLGLLGIALAAGAIALVWWATKKEEATQDSSSKAAINYVQDFTNKIKENTEQVLEQVKAMQAGKTAAEAFVDAQNKVQLQKVKEQNQSIVGSANENRANVYGGFDKDQKIAVQNLLNNNIKPAADDLRAVDAINKYKTAVEGVVAAQRKAAQLDKEATEALNAHVEANKLLAIEADKQAKARGAMPGGNETIQDEPKKAALNAAMNKELSTLQNAIDAAKKQANQEKDNAQSAYKQGLIGEIALIEKIREAEANRQAITGDKSAEKIAVLRNYANQESAIAQEQGNVRAALQATLDAEQDAANRRAEYSTKLVQDTQKAQAEAYYKNGMFVEAFKAEQGRKHDLEAQRLVDNYNTSADAAERFNVMMLAFANEEAKAAGIKVAANKEAEASFNVLADATRNAMKGIQTASEGQGLAAMFDAARAASAQYAAELPKLQAAQKLLTNPRDIEEANARMLNLAETQRKMWAGVGESISNSLEKAFGKSGKAAGDLIKIAQNYNNLENKTSSARVKAYGDAAGAAKNFFKEGSTGYEVLAKAEQAFRLIELAGMAKSLAATIADSSAKAVARIPEFMMAWGSLGPWGYAAGAVAIAAILGSSGGGSAPMTSAERQKTQGTGSVLGSDEKSASIANSLEIMEKNSGLGLVHSNEMVKHLRTLATSISGLASLVVRSTGITGDMQGDSFDGLAKLSAQFDGALGLLGKFAMKISNTIFGGKVTALDTGFTLDKTSVGSAMNGGISANQYTDTKKDGGWFSSDKYRTSMTSLGADANGQFSKIVEDMAGAINSAAGLLGLGGDAFSKKLQSFVIDIGKISLKGLTGAEIKEQLEAVFSKLGDDMAKFALAGFEQFQMVGEGYLETVARLANDLIQVKDVFAVLNKSFALTGMAAINVSQSLVEAAGGLEKLTEGTKYFVDNFLTEAERMGPITQSVARRLLELNMGEITSIDLFTKKIRALDLTNAADQLLYAALIELAPAFKEVADYADELAEGTTKLSKAQQKALDAITKARDNLQASYDKEADALQNTIDKTKSFIQTLKNYQDSLKLGADSPLTNMQKYAEARKQFDATVLAAKGGDQAAKDKLTGAASALLAASKIINASGEGYTSDFNLVQSMLDQMIGSATSQVDVATASLNALNQQVAGLLEVNKSVMSVTQAITELKAAIIAGGIAGLNNTQMGTTYTPTAAEITAATPTTTGSNQLAQSIAEMKDKIVAEMQAAAAAQAAQVGDQIKAAYDSTNKAAVKTSDAIDTIKGRETQHSSIQMA